MRTDSRWRPAPLLAGSVLLHALALVVVILRPALWPWLLCLVLADHLLLFALGLVPRSHALGANWTRLPRGRGRHHVAITVDDGPDPQVTPQVLRILAQYSARATFFCIGELADRHPDLVLECVRAGHAVENHSYQHRHTFALQGWWRLRRDLERTQRQLTSLTGVSPRFFRAPAGLRSPLLDPLLQQLGLTLASWTRRGFDTVSGDANAVLARLSRNLDGGDILLLHDGHAARSVGGEPVILQVLPRLLELLAQRGLGTVTLREVLAQSDAASWQAASGSGSMGPS